MSLHRLGQIARRPDRIAYVTIVTANPDGTCTFTLAETGDIRYGPCPYRQTTGTVTTPDGTFPIDPAVPADNTAAVALFWDDQLDTAYVLPIGGG